MPEPITTLATWDRVRSKIEFFGGCQKKGTFLAYCRKQGLISILLDGRTTATTFSAEHWERDDGDAEPSPASLVEPTQGLTPPVAPIVPAEPRGRGRPKKTHGELKNLDLRIPVTESQHAIIKAAAGDLGIAAWARQILLAEASKAVRCTPAESITGRP